MKTTKRRAAVAGAGLTVVMLAFVPVAVQTGGAAQAAPAAQGASVVNLYELHRLPGTVIAEGQNAQPAGHFQIKTYRVEELALPNPVTATVGGQPATVDRAWRLAVVGGPFPVRALPPVLWIDGVILGIGHESEDLTEISAITFDRAVLNDGATIGLTYGFSPENASELPEKLTIGG